MLFSISTFRAKGLVFHRDGIQSATVDAKTHKAIFVQGEQDTRAKRRSGGFNLFRF